MFEEVFKDQISRITSPTDIVWMAIGHESMGGPPRVVRLWPLVTIRQKGEFKITFDFSKFIYLVTLENTNIPLFYDTEIKHLQEYDEKY